MSRLLPIKTVLVANRGEIALRIIRTLKRLDISGVAIYHAVDAAAPHVLAADSCCEIDAEVPSAAYLDIAQIVEAARRMNADAVHPGYGFLAENGDFAEAVEAAGLIFIGPRANVIRLLGDKVASREFVAKHGFPLAPSVSSTGGSAELLARAESIGFPILIKAAAGGGGKGMHIVRTAAEFETAYELARSEAQRYFADSRVYCEKYLERPRHIEVQILADDHGNCLHLGERDCSIQRRFQKLIEESPAPQLAEKRREEICATAVAIAAAAGYTNAGTVEFIIGEDGNFYFLEMNTRLQVEHPVTEMTTGIDLVEQQIHIANGDRLGFSQAEVTHEGHAIEMRICAEDCEADFMPAVGSIAALRNAGGSGVRVDSGLCEGAHVSTAFDPMLAKLIVHAPDRDAAIAKAVRALAEQTILGVTTNISFLARVLGHQSFRDGDVHTHFLEQFAAALRRAPLDEARRAAILAIAALNDSEFQRQLDVVAQPHRSMGGWRNS